MSAHLGRFVLSCRRFRLPFLALILLAALIAAGAVAVRSGPTAGSGGPRPAAVSHPVLPASTLRSLADRALPVTPEHGREDSPPVPAAAAGAHPSGSPHPHARAPRHGHGHRHGHRHGHAHHHAHTHPATSAHRGHRAQPPGHRAAAPVVTRGRWQRAPARPPATAPHRGAAADRGASAAPRTHHRAHSSRHHRGAHSWRHRLNRLPRTGVDISWPQCRHIPRTAARLVTVGINHGVPRTTNPCLRRQLRYAAHHGRTWAYMNLAAPRHHHYRHHGRHIAHDALRRLHRTDHRVEVVWLDVETANHWSHRRHANRRVIRGALRELHRHHVLAGVYSTPSMWWSITRSMHLHVPAWVATGSRTEAHRACHHHFAGHRPLMTQYVGRRHGHAIDVDVVCRR